MAFSHWHFQQWRFPMAMAFSQWRFGVDGAVHLHVPAAESLLLQQHQNKPAQPESQCTGHRVVQVSRSVIQ